MDSADRHPLREFFATWQAFALAAVPAMLGSLWATFRLSPALSAIELAEWALLIALLTVVGSISQFGIKPGYMQEVTDRGAEHRYAALRISLLAVSTSGLLAGSLVAALLYFLWTLGEWHNLAVLPWLPLYGLLGNAGMMFQTDLRILGGARLLAGLALVTFPLSVLLLEVALRAGFDPLAAFFATQCAVALLTNVWLAYRSRILQHPGLDPVYLRRVLLMGLPVMGGLLAKYVADLALSSTFRWGVDTASAGAFGLAVRVTEPLLALYIGSFQMAWGAHIYGWIREAPDGSLASRRSSQAWWLAALGVPLGLGIAALVFALVQQDAVKPLDWLFAGMMISRVLAFGMASAMGYGQTLRRNYRVGMRLALQEMLLTITLLPTLAFAAGGAAAALVAAVIPWITVLRLRARSADLLRPWPPSCRENL